MQKQTLNRLKKDLKKIRDSPIHGCGVEPREDNFFLWDGVIELDFTLADDGKGCTIPMHFLIEFPDNYPCAPPNVGFSTPFEYNDGAYYVVNDSSKPLNGKFVICLDVLGNFAHVHTGTFTFYINVLAIFKCFPETILFFRVG